MNYKVLKIGVLDSNHRLRSVIGTKVLCPTHAGSSSIVQGTTNDDCEQCLVEWQKSREQFISRNSDAISEMNGKKIYLSGPMTGIPNFNRDRFWMIEHSLKINGVTVITPARQVDGCEWEWYMRNALKMMLDADGCFFLIGHDKSKGAKIERQLAKTLKMDLYYET